LASARNTSHKELGDTGQLLWGRASLPVRFALLRCWFLKSCLYIRWGNCSCYVHVLPSARSTSHKKLGDTGDTTQLLRGRVSVPVDPVRFALLLSLARW